MNDQRNNLKINVVDNPPVSNQYASFYLTEIGRFALCQTKETLLANKLVAPLDRYKKYKSVAGKNCTKIVLIRKYLRQQKSKNHSFYPSCSFTGKGLFIQLLLPFSFRQDWGINKKTEYVKIGLVRAGLARQRLCQRSSAVRAESSPTCLSLLR